MSTLSRYKDLLQTPTTADKLTLFRFLFDAKELTVDLTLALLKIIHKELSIRQTRDHALYKRYAEAIEALRYHMSDMLQQAIDAWNSPDQVSPPAEWFSRDNPTTLNNSDK